MGWGRRKYLNTIRQIRYQRGLKRRVAETISLSFLVFMAFGAPLDALQSTDTPYITCKLSQAPGIPGTRFFRGDSYRTFLFDDSSAKIEARNGRTAFRTVILVLNGATFYGAQVANRSPARRFQIKFLGVSETRSATFRVKDFQVSAPGSGYRSICETSVLSAEPSSISFSSIDFPALSCGISPKFDGGRFVGWNAALDVINGRTSFRYLELEAKLTGLISYDRTPVEFPDGALPGTVTSLAPRERRSLTGVFLPSEGNPEYNQGALEVGTSPPARTIRCVIDITDFEPTLP